MAESSKNQVDRATLKAAPKNLKICLSLATDRQDYATEAGFTASRTL